MDKNSSLAVGIDIGTSEVRCIIGRVEEDSKSRPVIIGQGSAKALGMRKGQIIDADEAAKAIDDAVNEAAQMAGADIGSATVNINGAHLISVNSQGTVAVNSGDGMIDIDELERVEESASLVKMPENREIIQIFAQNYRVDGQSTKNPVGMKGVRLEVDAHVVTAGSQAIKALADAMSLAELNINNRLLSSVAASDLVLNKEQKEHGVAVIDLGGSTTNVAVYEEEDLQFVSSIPVGSNNITNDIAIGLQIDLNLAEEIKLKYFRLGSSTKYNIPTFYELKHGGEAHKFKHKDVKQIVESRLDEMFDLINQDLAKINRSRKLPGGVVLLGGGSKLKGLDEYARKALGLPAHIAKVGKFEGINDSTKNQSWLTAVSLMYQDAMLERDFSLTQSTRSRRSAPRMFKSKSKVKQPNPAGQKLSSAVKGIIDRFKS